MTETFTEQGDKMREDVRNETMIESDKFVNYSTSTAAWPLKLNSIFILSMLLINYMISSNFIIAIYIYFKNSRIRRRES